MHSLVSSRLDFCNALLYNSSVLPAVPSYKSYYCFTIIQFLGFTIKQFLGFTIVQFLCFTIIQFFCWLKHILFWYKVRRKGLDVVNGAALSFPTSSALPSYNASALPSYNASALPSHKSLFYHHRYSVFALPSCMNI